MHKTYLFFCTVVLSSLFVFNLASAYDEENIQLPVKNEVEQSTFTPIPTTTISVIDAEATATLPAPRTTPQHFYVSKKGNNRNGTNWNSAWNELDQIDWSIIIPGDTIYLDGNGLNSSMTYTSTLAPVASGTADEPISIVLSSEDGRNGRAIFFGGNSIWLPECGQPEWDNTELESAGDAGIWIDPGVGNLVIDGTKRGGITIHGWKRAGILFDPDRLDDGIDNNSQNITLRFMEIYNNGKVASRPDLDESIKREGGETNNDGPNLFYPESGSPGIKLSGVGHKFEYLEIHDNAADAIQSNFTNPEGDVFNNIDDFTVSHSWFYNQRSHSGRDNSPPTEICTAEDQSGCDEEGAPWMSDEYFNYPAEPAQRRESFNWCTHNDAIQIYSSNDLNTFKLEKSIIGPNMMNALILGDKGNENTTAWVNDLVISDVLLTRYTNNALGMNNEKPNVGRNWSVDHMTIYGHFNKQNMGSLSLHSNASETEHRISNSINVFGRGEFPDGNVLFENNCEFNMYLGTVEGVVADPQFAQVNSSQDIFADDLTIDFATVFTEDYTPTNPQCAEIGSRLTSVDQLLALFEEESKRTIASRVQPTPTPLPTIVVAEDTPIPIVDSDGSIGNEPTPETKVEEEQETDLTAIDADSADQPSSEELSPLEQMADDMVVLVLAGLALLIFLLLLFLTLMVWWLGKQEQ